MRNKAIVRARTCKWMREAVRLGGSRCCAGTWQLERGQLKLSSARGAAPTARPSPAARTSDRELSRERGGAILAGFGDPSLLAVRVYRQTVVKWNGWGYRDSYFFMNPNGQAAFSGRRCGYGMRACGSKSSRVRYNYSLDTAQYGAP